MKNILIDNQKTTYYVDRDGRVFNKKTGNYYKGSIRGGYRQFDLRWNHKKQTFSQHRLVAEAYIPNPENLPIVHHKDGNRLNNRIENLEWSSYSNNNLKENRLITNFDHSDKNFYSKDELKNERWKNFRDTCYSISSLGRVKNNKTDRILKGKISFVGYREYNLSLHKQITFLGHRLVYEAFNCEELKVINHIDGNKLNNRIENLENITYLENNMKALYETKTRVYKKTGQFDEEGNLIQVFFNNAKAAEAMNIKPQSIQYAKANGTRSCGFYWKDVE